MWPLEWQYTFVPVLPGRLLEYLGAPVPWLIGLVRDSQSVPLSFRKEEEGGYLNGLVAPKGLNEQLPPDAVVVDLDNGKLCVPRGLEKCELPSRERGKLLARIGELCKIEPNGVPESWKSLFYKTGNGEEEVLPIWTGRSRVKGVAGAAEQRTSPVSPTITESPMSASPLLTVGEQSPKLPTKESNQHPIMDTSERRDLGGFDGQGRFVPSSSHPPSSFTKNNTHLSQSTISLTVTIPDSNREQGQLGFFANFFGRTGGNDRRQSDPGWDPHPLNADLSPSPTGPQTNTMAQRGASTTLLKGFSAMSVNVPIRPNNGASSGSLDAANRGAGWVNSLDSLGSASSSQNQIAYVDIGKTGSERMGIQGHELEARETALGFEGDCWMCRLRIRGSCLRCRMCGLEIHETCLKRLDVMPCRRAFDDRRIQEAFLRVFTSLLKDYKRFLSGSSTSGATFDGAGFLSASRPDARPFLGLLVETQSFAQFLELKSRFFDEAVEAKRNRSKLRITKAPLGFLRDSRWEVRQVWVAPVPGSRLNGGGEGQEASRKSAILVLDPNRFPTTVPVLDLPSCFEKQDESSGKAPATPITRPLHSRLGPPLTIPPTPPQSTSRPPFAKKTTNVRLSDIVEWADSGSESSGADSSDYDEESQW